MIHEDHTAHLSSMLKKNGLEIKAQEGKTVYLKWGYVIEIENEHLFKLIQDDQVIAPFADVEELCQFIKMDMQLNEKS
ncbi:MAG: hypothetical protein AAFZ15_16490 [Bacteroidota bacterium]